MQNIEEEITNQFSKELSDDIDFEVIAGILIECGWHLVELKTLGDRYRAVDILEWCEEHVKHKYNRRGHKFVFSDKGDAVNFTLRGV